ncbi:MAG: Ig-like domain-containing protein [Marinobacter sp.]|nr:Ig-like domain-containing protein [Marinobacter sp.]
MAQHFWTADDYSVGATTTDAWEERYEVDSQLVQSDADGKYLEIIHRNKASGGIEFLPSGDSSDTRVLALLKAAGANFDNAVYVRGNPYNISNRNFYSVDIISSVLRLSKYVNGTRTTLASVTNTITLTNQFWVELEAIGTTVRARVWADGDPKPAAPTLEKTNETSIAGPGAAGIGLYDITVKAYQFGVGTNGDTAPSSPVSSTPTITNIDTDNAVNQYQQAIANVSGFTETITSVTLGGAACTVPENDPTDDQITVGVPGSLATGTYDLVISGATETDTLTGVSYTQTHARPAFDGLVDSNSILSGQSYTAETYFRFVTSFSNGTLDTAAGDAAEWAGDIADYYTPNEGFTGDDTASIEFLYADGTTSATVGVTITVPDTLSPAIDSVTVPTAGTYITGESLQFTANWNEVVNVTGTPALNLNIGGSSRQANYVSGTGTAALVFSYTVQAGDEDTDGIVVSSLTLDGGTIQDAANNPAYLTLNSVGDTSGVLVDGVAPVISVNGLTTTDTTPNFTGSAGDAVSLTLDVEGVDVVYSQTYNITPSGGSWSQLSELLALGNYTLTLNGVDAAGNAATEQTATLSIVEEIIEEYSKRDRRQENLRRYYAVMRKRRAA